MSINALGYENQAAGIYNLFGVNGVDGVGNSGSGSGAQKSGSSGGDTVNISEEARALFARKLQMLKMENEQVEQAMKLGANNTSESTGSKSAVDNGISDEDRAAAGVEPTESSASGLGSSTSAGGVGASSGGGGGGGGGSSEGSEEDERQKELESELQSLQSQLLGIMSGSGDPGDKVQKAGPIENRVRAVEAELQAMKSQSTKSAKG